jgi:hypothetical protein
VSSSAVVVDLEVDFHHDNLLGMEIDFCAYLGDPAYADDDPLCGKGMEVGSASGGAALVTRHARGTREDAPRLAQP